MQKALPLLTDNASIILTASTTTTRPGPGQTVYGATKAAVRNLARTWAQELGGSLPEGDQAEALQRERSLLYVAATRARDELVIIHSGEPSELLPK